MFPNPLYRGDAGDGGGDGRRQRNGSNEQQSEGVMAVEELRTFKTYLTRRLEEIFKSNRSLELYEQVDEISFYLDVMSDSTSDCVHGVEGLKGFVSKIQEMQRKYPLSAPGSSRDETVEECQRSEWEDSGVSGDYLEVAKLRNKVKACNDWRIGEILKRADNKDDDEPQDWWGLTDKNETNSLASQQPASSNDELDIISIAGLQNIMERRPKMASILKNPIPQASAVPSEKPVQQQQHRRHHQHQSNYIGVPPTLPHQTKKPHWFFDDPVAYSSTRTSKSTSYDASRTLQISGNAMSPQPIITSTYVPGYGQVNITTPLQSVVSTPPPQHIPYQQYEYQVPWESHPCPSYQPQPLMMNPQAPANYAYNNPPSSRGNGFQRFRGAHRGIIKSRVWTETSSSSEVVHSLIPAPGTSGFQDANYNECVPNDGSGEDNLYFVPTPASTCSASSISSSESQHHHRRNNGFQRKARGAAMRGHRYFNKIKRLQEPVKRVTIKEPEKTNTRPLTQSNQPNAPLSKLKKKIDKSCDEMYKLGKKGTPERVEEPEPEHVLESPPPPPSQVSGEKDKIVNLEVVKHLLTLPKKERDRLSKDENALIDEIQKIPSKSMKTEKNDSNGKKQSKVPTPVKNAQDASKQKKSSFQELRHNLRSGCSSSNSGSEAGSIISSSSSSIGVCTRSTTRILRSQKGQINYPDKNKSDKPLPIPRARKQTGKRKAVPLRIESDNEDNDKETQSTPPTTRDDTETTMITRNSEKKQRENMKKLVQQAVDELRMEGMQKMGKKSRFSAEQDVEVDRMELGRRKFRGRTNENGGQIIGKDCILVNTNIGKINLGADDESGLTFVKTEVKQEVEDDVSLYDIEVDDDEVQVIDVYVTEEVDSD